MNTDENATNEESINNEGNNQGNIEKLADVLITLPREQRIALAAALDRRAAQPNNWLGDPEKREAIARKLEDAATSDRCVDRYRPLIVAIKTGITSSIEGFPSRCAAALNRYEVSL